MVSMADGSSFIHACGKGMYGRVDVMPLLTAATG